MQMVLMARGSCSGIEELGVIIASQFVSDFCHMMPVCSFDDDMLPLCAGQSLMIVSRVFGPMEHGSREALSWFWKWD